MARIVFNPISFGPGGLAQIVPIKLGGTGANNVAGAVSNLQLVSKSELNSGATGVAGLDANAKLRVSQLPTGAGGVVLLDANGSIPASYVPSGLVSKIVTLNGPTTVAVGQTATYTITNYDQFTTYNVSVSGGSASVNAGVVTLTAPSTTGQITLTINSVSFTINVIASVVNTPAITAPVNGATGISLKPTFTKSSFSVTGQAQTQTGVRWELSTDPAFTTLVDSYEGTSNYTSWTPSVTLSNFTTYYVRVKDQGSVSGYSAWSPVVSFTVVQQVNFVTVTNSGGDQQYRGLVKLGAYLYAVGYQSAQGQGNRNCVISKYDTNGNLIWHRCLRGVGSDEILEDIETDGTYLYVVGRLQPQDSGSLDALLCKYDTNGNLIWQRCLGGSNYETYVDIIISGGYIYVTGHQASQGQGNYDALFVKYDLDGNLIWQRGLGNTVTNPMSGITTDGSNIYTVGSNDSYVGAIYKHDTNGNLIWQKTCGLNGSCIVAILYSVGYIYFVARQSVQSQGGNDAYIAKCDTNGNLIWQRGLGGSGDDRFLGIATDGSYLYTVGYTASQGQGGCDALIAKYDTNGNLIWQRALGGSSNDLFLSLVVENGYIYATGAAFTGNYATEHARPSVTGGQLLLASLPTSGSITLGPLTGSGLTSLSWTQPTLTSYTVNATYSNLSLTAYTTTLTTYTPTVTTYTPTFIQYYSTF